MQKFDASKYHWSESKVKIQLLVRFQTICSYKVNFFTYALVITTCDTIIICLSNYPAPSQVRRHCVSQVNLAGHNLADYDYKDIEFISKVMPYILY